jgi:PST family polysaccharide transporter
MPSDPASTFRRLWASPAWHNFGWLTFDKGVRLTLGVVVGMWMARHLGPADYGLLNYALALASLASVFPALGLDLIVRRGLVNAPADAGRLLGTTFGLRLGAGLAAYVVLVAGAFLFEPDATARLAIAMAGVSLLLQPVLAIDLWFQSRLLSKHTVVAQSLTFGACAILRVILILRGAGLAPFLYLLALESVLFATLLVVTYLRGRERIAAWRWDAATAVSLLRESWPLAAATLATLVYVKFDQVLLRSVAGPTETGLYAAAARVNDILHTLPLMLAASFSPLLLAARQRGPAEYERSLRRFFNLSAGFAWAAALGCAALTPWVVPLVFGPAYARTSGMLVALALSLPLIAMGVARQEYLINEGRQKFQLVTTLVGAAVNVGLNLWAIPRWGGLGAAWVALGSHLAADLLTSLLWPPAQTVGRWQLRALTGCWRLPRPNATSG